MSKSIQQGRENRSASCRRTRRSTTKSVMRPNQTVEETVLHGTGPTEEGGPKADSWTTRLPLSEPDERKSGTVNERPGIADRRGFVDHFLPPSRSTTQGVRWVEQKPRKNANQGVLQSEGLGRVNNTPREILGNE